jgi:hypothetical protein
MVFYFEIMQNNLLTRKNQENRFCASFQFNFLTAFLVSENLVCLYEQLFIFRHKNASSL